LIFTKSAKGQKQPKRKDIRIIFRFAKQTQEKAKQRKEQRV
jgi:hypothetical protein